MSQDDPRSKGEYDDKDVPAKGPAEAAAEEVPDASGHGYVHRDVTSVDERHDPEDEGEFDDKDVAGPRPHEDKGSYTDRDE